MRKVGLVIGGLIAGAIAITNIGHIAGLAVSGAVLFWLIHLYRRTQSTGWKVVIGIIAAIMAGVTIFNIPAFIGLASFYVLYVIAKKWKKPTTAKVEVNNDDPFANFEQQWAKLNN